MVVVLQSHLLDAMPIVVIAPMLREDARSAYTRTSARVTVADEDYIVSIAEMVATETQRLRTPVGSLLDYEDVIRRALDAIFIGF